MILTDDQIHHRCAAAIPLVEPSDPSRVQPASYDFELGTHWRVFDNQRVTAVDLGNPESYADITTPLEATSFVLHPGEFVLGSTGEQVNMPTDLVGRVEGKSSLGRLGLIVHATAGYIDPGFHGVITLEMMNLLRVPIVLRSGMPICQLSFHLLAGEVLHPYDGRYQGDETVSASRY